MKLINFDRTVPYKRRKGIAGYFQIIFHNFFDLVLLNIMFVFTSLPVITLGASYSALIHVCNKYAEDIPVFPVKEYFRSFKKNMLKGSAYGLIFLAAFVIIVYSYLFYLGFGNVNFVFYIPALIALISLIILTFIFGFFFPVFDSAKLGFREILINSLILSFVNIFHSLLFSAALLIIWGITFAFFPYSIPLTALFPVSLTALASSCISMKKIRKMITNPEKTDT